jgi:uncharacterized protein (DUF1697 family)
MRCVLLLRGVNVGSAKRVPMVELKRMLSGLGLTDVRTLLNSGNAVFTTPARTTLPKLTATIEAAIEATFGFTSRSFVLSAAELDVVIAENPIVDRIDNPSRCLVAFLRAGEDGARLVPLSRQDWGAEAFGVGSRACYLWCAEGIATSTLPDAVGKVIKHEVTTRNWATVLKLQALCASG